MLRPVRMPSTITVCVMVNQNRSGLYRRMRFMVTVATGIVSEAAGIKSLTSRILRRRRMARVLSQHRFHGVEGSNVWAQRLARLEKNGVPGGVFVRALSVVDFISRVSGSIMMSRPPIAMMTGDARMGNQTEYLIIAEEMKGSTASAKRTAQIST